METIEIARRMAQLRQMADACKAYGLVIRDGTPEQQMEAALFLLRAGADYKIPYTCFLNLYREGFQQEEILTIVTGAFYEPNEVDLRRRYEKNCKLLKRYPYLFRKDFPAFEDLPILLVPYDDHSYIPFDRATKTFGTFIDINEQVVHRNFFCDLEKPVFADDVYSQYELEYLCDNVRKSEYVAKENHIYLHYTDWGTFCSYLMCLNVGPLLKEKKIVFLIEEEKEQYPIDFKERFGIDYEAYSLKPVGASEVKRMIWLCQLSSHNGINFFGELLDGHPNLITVPAISLDGVMEAVERIEGVIKDCSSAPEAVRRLNGLSSALAVELYTMRGRTKKDVLIAVLLENETYTMGMDRSARIAPTFLFQPHFGNMSCDLKVDEKGRTILISPEYEIIKKNSIFKAFKYIKTVAPMRRPTTGYGAAVRYMDRRVQEGVRGERDRQTILLDELLRRVLIRSYLVDIQDRLLNDSILVRFEDAKLNPTATLTALAAFMDIPYSESMTYCSGKGERDPETLKGDARGFDLRAVYETFDDYVNDSERYYIEYFMRDVYKAYNYDFLCYDGAVVDREKAVELVDHFDTINYYIRKSRLPFFQKVIAQKQEKGEWNVDEITLNEQIEKAIRTELDGIRENRLHVTDILLRDLHFVSFNGQPLRMMPLLQLDPALLEQPLYH